MTFARLACPPLLLAMAALGACAQQTPPIQVTRFHLGQPIAPAEVAVEPRDTTAANSIEFRTYAAAVQAELARVGFRPAAGAGRSEVVAVIDVMRGTRQAGPATSPFSIGLGGGTFSGGRRGGGVGLGGGITLPIGKRRANEVTMTQLSVQLKRRSEGTVIWEGRAQSTIKANTDAADPDYVMRDLAAALFEGFPGESGRTIEVR